MEVQSLVSKYSKAADFLNGIDLNPDTHPAAGYAAFNDTPITEYFQNSTKSALLSQRPLLAARDGDAEPILGLPGGPAAGLAVMPLTDDVVAGMDVAYYGPLRLGARAQELAVSVDTGSADLWVPVACPACSHAQFDAAASGTYVDTGRRVSVTYVRPSPPLFLCFSPQHRARAAWWARSRRTPSRSAHWACARSASSRCAPSRRTLWTTRAAGCSGSRSARSRARARRRSLNASSPSAASPRASLRRTSRAAPRRAPRCVRAADTTMEGLNGV